MEKLFLKRNPFALVLDRTVAPLITLCFGAAFIWTAWEFFRLDLAGVPPVVLLVLTGVGFCVLAIVVRRHAWPVAIELTEDDFALVTTTGRTTVSRKEVRSVSLAGNGAGLLGRAIALRYERDRRVEWLGLGNGYLDSDGTRLHGRALIRRLNAALDIKE